MEQVLQVSKISWILRNFWTWNLVWPACTIPKLSETTTPTGECNTSSALERTTQSSTAGGQIAPPWTNWWLNKWRENFISFWWGWGRMLSRFSLCGGGLLQLQSGEINNVPTENLPTPKRLRPPRKAWAQAACVDPPQSCLIGKVNFYCHTAQHTNLKGQIHRERACQKCWHLN
jgi:hypothetical protein